MVGDLEKVMKPNEIPAHAAGWHHQFRFAGGVLRTGVCEFWYRWAARDL
jgi:hypothetical protein